MSSDISLNEEKTLNGLDIGDWTENQQDIYVIINRGKIQGW